MTHIFAESTDSINAGMLVVGTKKPFFKIAPGRLKLEYSEREAGVRLQLSGIDLSGKKISELISLKEEETRTSKEYTHINSAQILSNKNRESPILIYDGSGELVLEIPKENYQTHTCCVKTTAQQEIISWSVGNNGDGECSATYAQLVVYRNERRLVLDAITCTQTTGHVSRTLSEVFTKEGDVVAIEFLSSGDGGTVRAAMQIVG